jgi:hypothetical protein
MLRLDVHADSQVIARRVRQARYLSVVWIEAWPRLSEICSSGAAPLVCQLRARPPQIMRSQLVTPICTPIPDCAIPDVRERTSGEVAVVIHLAQYQAVADAAAAIPRFNGHLCPARHGHGANTTALALARHSWADGGHHGGS